MGCVLLCFGTCIASYCVNPRMETDRVCIGMAVTIRIFFMIAWVVYGSLIIKSYIAVDKQCYGMFKQDMNNVIIWFLPIISINMLTTGTIFIITIILWLCFCKI